MRRTESQVRDNRHFGDVHSIAVTRLRVFTQPRPKADRRRLATPKFPMRFKCFYLPIATRMNRASKALGGGINSY
jgi:hypothetical protein